MAADWLLHKVALQLDWIAIQWGGTELPEHISDHPNRIALSEAFIPRTSIGPSCEKAIQCAV